MYRLSLALVGAGVMLVAAATQARGDEVERLLNSARIVNEVRADIPAEYWDKARCVAVIPDLKKAAFIVGGEYGKGVMSCRSAATWSAPLFMQLAKGSWGFQAGAEQVDLVLLVMNDSGVQKLLKNKVNLGADASVAAGPIGRRGSVGTDAALSAEIVSYSRSKGLFAGIDLSGGVLRPDDDANHETYGRSATPSMILASRDLSAPTAATPFIRALANTSSGVSSDAPTATPAPTSTVDRRPSSTPPPPTTVEDVRGQLIDAQQVIDRILADTTPSAVGTSGTTGNAGNASTVTVERSRLLQLRAQIDAAIAALSRR